MTTTFMSNFKEIHQYLVLLLSKNLQKLRIPKFSITFFLDVLDICKDENGIIELALKS